MDKDTREHYAALVGRLRRGDGSYRDADEAADAIEDLVAKLDAGRTPIKWRWVLPEGYEIRGHVVAEGDPETGEQHGEREVWSWRGRGETGDCETWRDALKECWRHWAETGEEAC